VTCLESSSALCKVATDSAPVCATSSYDGRLMLMRSLSFCTAIQSHRQTDRHTDTCCQRPCRRPVCYHVCDTLHTPVCRQH